LPLRHQKLLSNFFAQTEALAFGKSREVVEQEYRDQGKDVEDRALGEDFVLIQRNQCAQAERGNFTQQDGVGLRSDRSAGLW
jgi:glucose-6-phosphate isomerase